jgi:signal transduction histidine kinase
MPPFLHGLLAGLAGGLVAVTGVAALFLRRLKIQTDKTAKAQAAQRQSHRLAELGALTGVLAHEIKNPLSTVGLNLQLLQEDLGPLNGDSDRLRNRLSIVQRETSRLREILDDFLRYAGKLELDRRPVDLNAIVEELVDFFSPQAQLQHVQLRLRLNPRPVVAEVDAKVLKQALLNLMINAVQAIAGSGQAGAELILSVNSPMNHKVVIDVIDTGPGIPPDALDKIFQADYSTKKGGAGLGLAMARRIAEEHGGTLSVRSELGKGSDFSLMLPLTRAAASKGHLDDGRSTSI